MKHLLVDGGGYLCGLYINNADGITHQIENVTCEWCLKEKPKAGKGE
jgi:hypothetical protein